MTDYSLWEVILNGNKVLKRQVRETEQIYEPTTAEEKQDKRNEMKARGTLLMALPNKDQLKFHSYKDAKLLMEAIEKRYGGNKESKKVQRTLLKQQYKNFAGSSSETMDQTFDRSLPYEWKTHALIWRNKEEIETISLDDLYNNLKIYEPELTRSSSTSQNLQNVAFVSSNSTNSNSSTNEADNTTYGVSVAHTQSNLVNSLSVDNLSDAVIFAFLASQPNSPQIAREDLEQIDPDDLEEMDLHWEMAMLTIRARRLIKRTGRKLDINGQRIGFDKENGRRTVTVETPTENALIAQDKIGGYDWSYQAEEEHPTNFALIAYTSSGSSSNSDFEVDSCSKTCVKAYAILKEQYDKSINVLKLEVRLRDNALVEYKKKLEKAIKERDELKLTLEKFQNSFKSLNNLLESQVSDKFKTRLGYNAASSTAASPAVESFVNSSEMLENQEYNKSKLLENKYGPSPACGLGPLGSDPQTESELSRFRRSDYGGVLENKYGPSPACGLGNFIPSIPDLMFMDGIVESENMDVITVVTPSNLKKVESNHESANVKNNGDAVEPKTVRKNSFRPPVIEDWNSNDDSEVEFIVKDKTVRTSTEKIKKFKSARETVDKVIKPVWNNSSRVNHKYFANKMTHPYPNRIFVPQAVLTRSGKINTTGASVNTAVRPVNTAGSKPTVNHPRLISNAYKKGYSQVTRPFNKYLANKNSIFNKKVNTVRVKDTTARDRVVVSENKKKGVNVVKASIQVYNGLDPQKSLILLFYMPGNPHQKEYKEKEVFDSGRISGKGKIKTGTLDFDNVYFCKELKYNLFSVSQICDKKNNVLFTDTECLFLSLDFKLFDESQVLLRVPRNDNIYNVDLKSVVPTKGLTYLFAKAIINESNLWHKRLGHINFKNINKLVKGNLVRGLPLKIFKNDHSCVACQKGKQHKASCKTKLVNSISKPLHMLYMDLFGPTNVKSLMKKSYCLVVIDFLGAEAVNTACYVLNRVLVIKPHTKTPYELIRGRTPLIDFMKPFGCPVTILNTRDHLGKFDGKADEGFFVGYSVVCKAMRVFNERTRIVEESLNIRFLENAPNVTGNGPD
ncbi:ribonuclease H-like domain-containing protein [Tanacetum coccineum]